MKRFIGTLLSLLLVAVMAACAAETSTAPPQGPTDLEVGESITAGDTTITLVDVNDSRCPADAVCVTAGEALVTFAVAGAGEVEAAYSEDPDTPTEIAVQRLTITILDVQPYPSSATEGQPKVVTVSATAAE